MTEAEQTARALVEAMGAGVMHYGMRIIDDDGRTWLVWLAGDCYADDGSAEWEHVETLNDPRPVLEAASTAGVLLGMLPQGSCWSWDDVGFGYQAEFGACVQIFNGSCLGVAVARALIAIHGGSDAHHVLR